MQSSESMFRVPPFPAFPSASRYVNLGSLADALQRVVRSVDAREGLSLVIGPPGTGKSLLCSILTEHFSKDHEVVTLGETPIDSGAAMLRRVLHQLGVKLSSVPDNDLQLALIDRVCGKDSPAGGLLILVDEAQSLPCEVLESIRMTTNIMRRGEPRVSAVVCGGPRLDDTLTSGSMEPFTQRIATRCYLHPMSTNETREYIREAIRRCGAEPSDTITDEAISAVHHACSGVPRLINQLMTQAVDCAEAANRTLIGLHEINVAWAQLQQLPSPMLEEPSLGDFPGAKPSIVEFGELADSDESVAPNKQSYAFEDDEHAEQVFEFKSTQKATSPGFYDADGDEEVYQDADCHDGDKSDGVDRALACGTTCGCDPEVCEREVAAINRIDEMAQTLETIDANDPDCLETCGPETIESSAQWISEPGDQDRSRHVPPQSVVQMESRAPLPSALFGDFDQEEEIAVGRPIAATRDDQPTQNADLESMLHEEIVGMSSAMHLYQFPDEAINTFGAPTGEYEPSTSELRPTISPADSQVGSQVESHQSSAYAVPYSSPQSDMMISSDDSDILIIEEDVDVHGRVEPPRMRREESTISVDFQAMLTRMRSS